MKKCPVCEETRLETRHRNDIEIDCCPKCRGIWLDRGELEKIIDRSTTEGEETPHETAGEKPATQAKKRKRNLITELFDF